ncbi:oligopeptide ABC transporter substrate-binding protein [Aliicoccus persicus]|uniref:Peptide/nickel transport system substrate-binding protein n=1 Tax=Aliicoccus persicus TaxID=930138 RepID=A0A662Z3I5_9STAP|nr:oligopeptide ABC transporter substrate-binding protein [Aliicoccus persicus]SEW02614.1 peptide/nickel transport system substrate-binding protein [Aliicoccus persicus]
MKISLSSKKLMSTVLGTGVALTVLGIGNSDVNAQEDADVYDYADFPQRVTNDAEPTGEGELRVAYVSDTPFEGTLNYNFYQGAPDAAFIDYFDESVLTIDENQIFTQDGALTFELNHDDNTVTFTLEEGILWHDGVEATINDYVASYEVIGHPDYTGVRGSTPGFTLIEGYNDYRAGDADSISGIEVIDDYTATFQYEELPPSLLSGGFWSYLFPSHHYEGVEVADMPDAPQTRENPIGIGPYKVDSITSGEAVVYERFDDYWRGTPQLDSVVVQTVSPAAIANSMANGDYHIASGFPTDQFPDVADMEGVEWLAQLDPAYTYIGFKLGHWDNEANEVVYDPENAKMGDVNLRKAMWHAIDNDTVGERFYNGLRWKATSLTTPYHATYHKDDLEVPEFDVDLANQILDEAGYEYDGDFRTTPEGEPLTINFASMSGGDTAEPLANYYIQSWRNIGLDVQLTNGRLIEFNTFYDMVENDNESVDIYQGAWGVGTDADPSGLYGRNSAFNYTRYASEENDELMAKINSQDSLDIDYRTEAFHEWQELMAEEIPVIPTLYRAIVMPVSEDVVNYSLEFGFNEDTLLYNVGLSESE